MKLRNWILSLSHFYFIFFLISVSFIKAQQHIVLELTKTQTGSVASDSYTYYKVNVPDITPSQQLAIILSPYSADSDLYVSVENQYPTKDAYNWFSSNIGGDIVEIPKTHPKFRAGDFYIGVRGYLSPSEFTIVAHIRPEQHLEVIDGQPQHSYVAGSKYSFYKYFLNQTGDFRLALTSVKGDPDIYISTTIPYPTKTNFTWKHTDSGSDVFIIKQNDPNYKTNAWYYIGIEGWLFNAEYVLVISHEQTTTLLPEGIALHESVPTGAWRYFKLKLLSRVNVTISLTKKGSRGDPDLYVSAIYEKPSEVRREWWSIGTGNDDIIHITTNHPDYKSPSWYYIGVKGFFEANFTLLASTDLVHTTLSSGRPQIHRIEVARKYKYFKYFYLTNEQNDLDFFVQPTSSTGIERIQVYVSKSEDNRFPTREKYDYSSSAIGRTGAHVYVQAAPHNQYYYISVYAMDAATTFSIIATPTTKEIELKSGRSLFYSAARNTARNFYYDVPADENNLDVTFAIHQRYGFCTVFVDVDSIPNQSNYTWTMWSFQYNALVIPANHPKRKPNERTRFRIAVFGRSNDLSYYDITAYTGESTVSLIPGRSQVGIVQYQKYSYFKFEMPSYGSVTINLRHQQRLTNNFPVMFISGSNEKPRRGFAEYISRTQGSMVFFTNTLYAGNYYIGVEGNNINNATTFSITVNIGYTQLPPYQINYFDSVLPRQFRYYQTNFARLFPPTDDEVLFFGLTLVSGYTIMLVNDNERLPTMRNYTYRIDTYPGNTLHIPKSDPRFKLGTWSVGIYGFTTSEYMIRSGFSGYQGWLALGLPEIGEISGGEQVIYTTSGWEINGTEVHTITVKDMAVLKIALLTVYVSQDYRRPNATHHTWKLENFRNYAIIRLNADQIKSFQSFYISITSNMLTQFVITVDAESTPIYLTQESGHERRLVTGRENRFQLHKSSYGQKLVVYSESCEDGIPPVFRVSGNEDGRFASSSTYKTKYIQYFERQNRGSDTNPMWYIFMRTDPGHTESTNIYASSRDDTTPTHRDSKITVGQIAGSLDHKHFSIQLKQVIDPISGFDASFRTRYIVFRRQLKDENVPVDRVNFHTPCAARNGIFVGDISYSYTSPNQVIGRQIDIPRADKIERQTWLINVVAISYLGRRLAYDPVKVTVEVGPGAYYGDGLIALPIVFFVLSLFALAVAFVLYWVIGILINKFRYKKEGIQLIPHIWLWIKVFSCCIRRSSYTRFDDSEANAGSVNQETTGNTTGGSGNKEYEEPEVTMKGGYGSL